MTTLSSLYGKGLVSDVAYPTGWDGETDIAPSKNVVYDEMETKANIDDPTFTTKITTPTINLTGGQIAFPATAVPSADANTLDDYEEGTYTPVLTPAGGTITMTENTGRYTKTGNVVSITCFLNISSVSSPTGSLTITGLPFTNGPGSTSRVGLNIFPENLVNIATTSIVGMIYYEGTTVYLYKYADGVSSALSPSIQANSKFSIGGTYLT